MTDNPVVKISERMDHFAQDHPIWSFVIFVAVVG
jgi:hypothetical protein